MSLAFDEKALGGKPNESVLVERAERILAALERSKMMIEDQINQGGLIGDITKLKVDVAKIDVLIETLKSAKLEVLVENVRVLMEDKKARQDKRWAVWLLVFGVVLGNIWPIVMMFLNHK